MSTVSTASTVTLALPSAFGLTCLLFIGLAFFIRASTKDRTETAQYVSSLDQVSLLEALRMYFAARAYQVKQIHPDSGQIVLEGQVRASIFLAIFLGVLAGIGLFCLALVIAIALPGSGSFPFLIVLASPLASWFYWRGATRVESVAFQLQAASATPVSTAPPAEASTQSHLTVVAHRDELLTLEAKLPLKRTETAP